jgi:hypothetical protein
MGLKRVSRPAKSISELFFEGNHETVVKELKNESLRDLSNEDYHFIFASLVILDRDSSKVAKELSPPLDFNDFINTYNQQEKIELEHNLGSILSQPKFLRKNLLAARIGRLYEKNFFIETGTYVGVSLYKISSLFKELWSIEADPILFKAASELFRTKGIKNVKIHLGDSKDFLKKIPSELGNNGIFFLDAHYSQGITSRRFGVCPVIQEITIIIESSPEAVIVVDDIRTMNGKRGYPHLIKILEVIPKSYTAKIYLDQLIIKKSASNCKFV